MRSPYLIVALLIRLKITESYQDTNDEYHLYEEFLQDGLLARIANQVEEKNGAYNAPECARDLSTWYGSLLKETWSLKMMDSAGKLPEALLLGNTYSLGQFDECLSVKAGASFNNITGKYCLVNFYLKQAILQIDDLLIGGVSVNASRVPNTVIRMGVCMPASCDAQTVQTILNDTLLQVNKTMRPIVKILDERCKIDEPPTYSDGAIISITILSCFAALLLVGTLYDLYRRHCRDYDPMGETSRGEDLLVSFSVFTNTQNMMRVSRSTNTLKCLNGLRAISMCWIVLHHRYSMTSRFPLQNIGDSNAWLDTLPSTFIMIANLAVDTFFVMSGLLLAYVFFRNIEMNKSFNVGMFYLHRFLRIWPALAAIVMFQGNLLVHLGSGPVWYQVKVRVAQPCQENWWLNILFIQNFMRTKNMCLGHLWYVAVDTQLYLLSPILLIPILYKPKIGFYNMIFWTIAAQMSTITVSYLGEWSGVNSSDPTYGNQYYRAIHVRASVWMLGFVAGYVIYKTKNQKVKMNKILVTILWICALGTLLVTVLGSKEMYQGDHEVTQLQDGTYNAFARSAWGLAVIWIIFACVNGYGGPINWFLSWNVWEIIGRLSYSMYLIHTLIQAVQIASKRTTSEFNHFQIFYSFVGDLIYSSFISYLWVMAFEVPFLGIEKALFHKKKVASAKEKSKIETS